MLPQTTRLPLMSDRFVLAHILQPLAIWTARRGIQGDELIREAGLSPQALSEPSALLSARDYDALACALQKRLNHPALALHIGEMLRTDMLNTVGLLIATATDFREAFEQFLRFKPLVNPCGDLTLTEEGLQARVTCHIGPEQRLSGGFHYAEMYFSTIITITNALRGHPIRVYRIEFSHDGSAYLDDFRRIFGADTDIRFNAPENIIVAERDFLDEPLPSKAPAFNRQIEQLAQRQLADLPQGDTMTSAVLHILDEFMGQRILDIEEVARQLEVTSRTLQRRLQEEDTTYLALRDHVRYRHAQRYLCDPALGIDRIAARLGFSESANFYRAFKGWSGVSPGEYRRQHATRPALAPLIAQKEPFIGAESSLAPSDSD